MASVRVFLRRLAVALLGVLSLAASAANPPEVDRGLAWLSAQVRADGSIAGEGASVATPLQARAETLLTLRQLATAPTALAATVASEPATPNEYLAREAAVLAPLGIDVSAKVVALLATQNTDGGFGG